MRLYRSNIICRPVHVVEVREVGWKGNSERNEDNPIRRGGEEGRK